MLPAKIGDGVLGSSSGGENPAGASTEVSASAETLKEREEEAALRWGLEVRKERVEDCFHGMEMPVDLGVERDGVKRVA